MSANQKAMLWRLVVIDVLIVAFIFSPLLCLGLFNVYGVIEILQD